MFFYVFVKCCTFGHENNYYMYMLCVVFVVLVLFVSV